MRVLVPVDGSDSSLHAVEHVINLAKEGLPVSVNLLNVHYEPVPYGDVGVAMTAAQAAAAERREGDPAMATAERLLRAAGVAYEREMRAGEIPQAIVKRAEDLGSDAIFMGTRGANALANLVIGSVAAKVVQLSKVPVTLVK